MATHDSPSAGATHRRGRFFERFEDADRQMRLFIALELSAEIRRALRALIETHRRRTREARWVSDAQLHITLRFLGEITPDAIPAITDLLDQSCNSTNAFDLSTAPFGGFPNHRSPRVLWVGVNDAGACARWVASTATAFESIGFKSEERPFTPHITLARAKTPSGERELEAILNDAVPLRPLQMTASELTLFRSELLPDGPRYTPLHQAKFASSAIQTLPQNAPRASESGL